MHAVTDDVAALKAEIAQLQARLADREALLHMLEHSLDGVWDWTIATGADYLSPRWKRMLGYDDEELPNTVQTWQTLLAPGELERGYAAVKAHWETGEPYEITLRYLHKDGSSVWMLARGKAIKGADGEWERMAGTHTNVTELRAAVARERQLNSAVVERHGDGIVVADDRGNFVLYNEAAASIAGIEPGPTSTSISSWAESHDLFDPKTNLPLGLEDLPLTRALRGEQVDEQILELRSARFNGARTLKSWSRPLDGGYAVVGFTDITESRELQRALERSNAELQQFAYVASHDLQEPLRKISGFCRLLQDDYGSQLDEMAQQYIAYAVDGATRMQSMIADLLTFAEAGGKELELESIDVGVLVQEVVDDLAAVVRDKHAEVVFESLPTVSADRRQLRQLLQNLISNALKFAGDASPRVLVTAIPGPERCQICVADNGIGIEPDDRERVFGVFERLHSRKDYPGSGIGLSLCKRIVERHDGCIWVEPSSLGGTAFMFALPNVPSGERPSHPDSAPASSPPDSPSSDVSRSDPS